MFWKLGFVIKFHGFSEDVKHANPGVEIDHETIVRLWSRKINELWPKWQTKKELDERKRYLAMALFRAAVNGNDDEKYKVEFTEQGEGSGVMFGRDEVSNTFSAGCVGFILTRYSGGVLQRQYLRYRIRWLDRGH